MQPTVKLSRKAKKTRQEKTILIIISKMTNDLFGITASGWLGTTINIIQ